MSIIYLYKIFARKSSFLFLILCLNSNKILFSLTKPKEKYLYTSSQKKISLVKCNILDSVIRLCHPKGMDKVEKIALVTIY